MLEFLTFALWCSLGAYTTWLIGRAKQSAPLSPNEAYILWRIHKSEARCNSPTYYHIIRPKKGIIGFRCHCGHEYLSKRPII